MLFFLSIDCNSNTAYSCVDKDPIFHYCLHWYGNEWETSCWQPAPWTSCINYCCARDKHHQNRIYRTTHSPISFAFNFNYFIQKECWTHKSGDWRPLIFSCSSNYLLLLLLMLLRARDSFHQWYLRFALRHSVFFCCFSRLFNFLLINFNWLINFVKFLPIKMIDESISTCDERKTRKKKAQPKCRTDEKKHKWTDNMISTLNPRTKNEQTKNLSKTRVRNTIAHTTNSNLLQRTSAAHCTHRFCAHSGTIVACRSAHSWTHCRAYVYRKIVSRLRESPKPVSAVPLLVLLSMISGVNVKRAYAIEYVQLNASRTVCAVVWCTQIPCTNNMCIVFALHQNMVINAY